MVDCKRWGYVVVVDWSDLHSDVSVKPLTKHMSRPKQKGHLSAHGRGKRFEMATCGFFVTDCQWSDHYGLRKLFTQQEECP